MATRGLSGSALGSQKARDRRVAWVSRPRDGIFRIAHNVYYVHSRT